MFIKSRKVILFSMFALGFSLGPHLQRVGGPLQKLSTALFDELRRGVGNSFQPTFDTSREALTSYIIARTAKMNLTPCYPFSFITMVITCLAMWDTLSMCGLMS